MKCSHYLSFALFALLGVFFGSFIINQNQTVSAISNSFTWSSTQTAGGSYLCGVNSSYSCSDFSYLYITNDDTSVTTGLSASTYFDYTLILSNGTNISGNRFYPFAFDSYFVDLTSNISAVLVNARQSSNDFLNAGGRITFQVTTDNPFSGSSPSGSLEITENGTYDVTDYSEAVVNVPETECPPSSGGDYHQDLVAINNSIMICAATCLVIYFFYCIYRMIIRNSGVK